MKVLPEIVIDGALKTPRIKNLIDRGMERLEQVCDNIVSTRIALEQAQNRHHTGNAYKMRVDVRLPDHKELVVKRSSVANKKVPTDMAGDGDAEDDETPTGAKPVRRSEAKRKEMRSEILSVLIARTFDAATRELQKTVALQRRDVKAHPTKDTQAVVERLVAEQGYGFLRTLDGQQVYFHRNSVLYGHWARLTVGAGVRYTPEIGEKGLQASSVEMVYKRGPAEIHDSMHDLPEVQPKARRVKAS
jgi:cold shock CspA family protein